MNVFASRNVRPGYADYFPILDDMLPFPYVTQGELMAERNVAAEDYV